MSRSRLFDAIGSQLVLAESLGEGYPRVGEDYEIRRILGGGGFGLVCEAEQLNLKRRVALKLFPLGGEGDAGVREALREARSLAKLEHASIVGVMNAGESQLIGAETLPCAFVEMQLVDGMDLRAWLEAEVRDAPAVVELLVEAGRALAYAHAREIVHRDFKPENLMVDATGHARVVDFGLAIAGEQASAEVLDALGSRSTRSGMVRGTPAYMAPEALASEPSPASDQFALAVVLREALTGKHPFVSQAVSANEVRGGAALAAKLAPVLERAMAVAPDDRFASVDDFCDALEASQAPAAAPEATAPEPEGQRSAPWGLAAAGVAALALGGWALSGGSDPSAPIDPPAPQDTGDTPTSERQPATGPATEPTGESGEAATPKVSPKNVDNPLAPAGGDCPELRDWDGVWKLGARVLWTEYAYQLDWNLAYEVDFRFGDDCSVQADWTKHPGWLDGETPEEPLVAVASGRATPAATGGWDLTFRVDFPGDRKSYGKDEFYTFDLHLDRQDKAPRVRGAFAKSTAEQQDLRNGILVGHRQRAPASITLRPDGQDCETRCIVECAGKRPTRVCRTRSCTAPEIPEPLCTAPSSDFKPPLRAYATRKTVLKGESPLERALARGSKKLQLEQCRAHAKRLVGVWSVWRTNEARDPTQLTVKLERDEGCRLQGQAERVDGSEPTTLRGEVTAAGTWLLTPETPTASFPHPFVLIGVGADAPAVGIDTGPSPERLRAQRKAVGP